MRFDSGKIEEKQRTQRKHEITGDDWINRLMLGGIGAALALAAIAFLYSSVSRWLGGDLAGLTGLEQVRFLGWFEIGIMLAGGVGVGAAAGAVASRAVK